MVFYDVPFQMCWPLPDQWGTLHFCGNSLSNKAHLVTSKLSNIYPIIDYSRNHIGFINNHVRVFPESFRNVKNQQVQSRFHQEFDEIV